MMTISRYRKTGFITSFEKRREISGIWWIPENQNDKVSGILSITPDGGIVLELTGYFEHLFDRDKLQEYEIINGHTREGGLITLISNYEIIKKIPFGKGTIYQFYNSKTVIWGHNFTSFDSIKFKNFYIEFPFFNSIFREYLIESDFKENKVKYSDSIDYTININDISIIIRLYNRIKSNAHKFEIEQKGELIVNFKSLIDYTTFKLKYLCPLQDFLGFISDSYNHVVELKAQMSRNDSASTFYIYDTFSHKRNKIKEIDPLITINEKNAKTLPELISNWFIIYDKLKIVIDLYTDVIYRDGYSPKIQFLLLVQSAEYYHTYSVGGKSKNLQYRLDELFEESRFVFKELFSNFSLVTQKIKALLSKYSFVY